MKCRQCRRPLWNWNPGTVRVCSDCKAELCGAPYYPLAVLPPWSPYQK